MQIDRAVGILFPISAVILDRHDRHLANHPMIIAGTYGARVAHRTEVLLSRYRAFYPRLK